jgi:hypothetical protein
MWGYPTFNGAATNYSGIERNTSGNNTLYLLVGAELLASQPP